MRLSCLLVVPVGLLLQVACSPGASETATDLDDGFQPDTGEPTDEPADTDVGELPRYWSLDGEIVLDESAGLDTEQSTVTIGYWSTQPLCEADAPILTAIAATADPDVPVFGWWQITIGEAAGCEAYESLTGTLNLGIGAWDARLEPAATAQQVDPGTVYGLYLQEAEVSGASVFVYGAAGTQDHYEGEATPVSEGPLPAGRYELRGLHLLPL